MPDQANKKTLSSVGIVANSTTMRQNVGRRKVSRLSQVDNLPTSPQILTTTIVAECL